MNFRTKSTSVEFLSLSKCLNSESRKLGYFEKNCFEDQKVFTYFILILNIKKKH